MASLLHQLENNEAILLMYLADELGADDRREVEQMLARDAGLRAELERIRSAQEVVTAAIGAMDQAAPLPVSTTVASRQIARLMKQWQVDRLSRPAMAPEKHGPRFSWWVYPTAAAAGLLIALMVWWGSYNGPGVVLTQPATGPTLALTDDGTTPAPIQTPAPAQGDVQNSDENGLADAEQQASALVRRSDDGAVTASIFMTEPMQ